MANKEVLDQINAERITRTTDLHALDGPDVGESVASSTLATLVSSWSREAELLSRSQKKGWQSEAKTLGTAVVLLKLEITALEKMSASRPPVREPVTGPTPSWTNPEALDRLVTDAQEQGRGKLIAGDAPCVAEDVHLAHTWVGPRDQASGSDRWRCPGVGPLAGLGTVKCSGCGDPVTVDQQDCSTCLDEEFAAREPLTRSAPAESGSITDDVAAYLSGTTNELTYQANGRAIIEQAAAQLGEPLQSVSITRHTSNGTPYTVSGQAAVIERLGTHLATGSAVHQEIDATMSDVHADPIAPMFTDSTAPTSRARPVPSSMVDTPPATWADLAAPATPSTIPDHMSPSQLSTLDTCPAQARLSRYEGNPGIPLWGAVGGTAFHLAVEEIEHEVRTTESAGILGWTNPSMLTAHWNAKFHAVITEEIAKSGVPMSDWYASAGGKENYSWWLVEGGEMVKRYVTYRVTHDDGRKVLVLPDGRPAIELELTLDLNVSTDHGNGTGEYGVLPVKVILDIVWQLPDGSLEIWDHKTRRDYMGPIVDTIQLGTQARALLAHLNRLGSEEHYPSSASITARYFDARKGELTPAFDPLDRHPVEELEMRYADADDKRRNRPAIPVRSNLCKACPVAYLCPVGSKL